MTHTLWLTLAKISSEGLTELSLRFCFPKNADIDSWLINQLAAKTATKSLKIFNLEKFYVCCEKTREDFAQLAVQVFQVKQIALTHINLSYTGWNAEQGKRVLSQLAAASICTLEYLNLSANDEWITDEVVDDLIRIISVNK